MRFSRWLVVVGLLASGLDAHAGQSNLDATNPTPSVRVIPGGHLSPKPWDNATFQFQASPTNPEVTVRMERSDQPLASVAKIIVTSESRTHEIAASDIGFFPTDIFSVALDVGADQDGEAFITLQFFYDLRVNLPNMPGGFKVMQIGISKMQSHQIHVTELPFPQ